MQSAAAVKFHAKVDWNGCLFGFCMATSLCLGVLFLWTKLVLLLNIIIWEIVDTACVWQDTASTPPSVC